MNFGYCLLIPNINMEDIGFLGRISNSSEGTGHAVRRGIIKKVPNSGNEVSVELDEIVPLIWGSHDNKHTHTCRLKTCVHTHLRTAAALYLPTPRGGPSGRCQR